MIRNYLKKAVVMFISFVMLIGIFPNFSVSAEDVSNLQPVDSTYAFIKSLEGYSSECFWDVAQWTIGYGNKCPYTHTSNGVRGQKGGHTISEAQARELFSSKLSGYVSTLKSNCKGLSMTQNQFDALLSATYNHGNVKNCPLKYYLQGKLTESEARVQYYEWCINAGTADEKGLRNRRKKEADLFFSNPVHTTLSVTPGNSSTATVFNWSYVPDASEYDIKIWKNVLWEGEPYLIEWGIKANSWKTVLPDGTYYAYVDARVGSDICMSNTVEIVVNKSCKLEVKSGNSSTETIFSWNELKGASEYDVKIWKDTLWEGDPYLIKWSIKNNSWETVLPEGTYYAYVDARVGSDICMSNTVEIVVNKGCKLEVKSGNTSTETIFSWNELKGASEYDVKIWKDALWEGDPYLIKWSIKTNSWETVLPEGTYYAYVDARVGSDICMSNTVEIVVNKGCKLEVKAGNSSTKTIFSWNELKDASEYDVKIWKDALWEGDPYLIKWSIKTDSWETVLPEGTYYAYVDARIGSDICISNVQKFNIEEKISMVGDINLDGKFNISDVVLLQKWLLAVPDIEIANWKAADLCKDGRLDVFDLCLMKRMLVENS